MGQQVETLEDLLRAGLQAVCVGINPSPVSVSAGHYYQGRAGQRFFDRLRFAGVLPDGDGYEDDLAFSRDIGFTDIIKRPTASAKELQSAEFDYGRELLSAKLDEYRPRLAIFTFKKAATALFGDFAGNGFVPGLKLAHSEVFVMPGPYEAANSAKKSLQTLAHRFAETQNTRLGRG
jgi:TDG/mug DNA glycosylase family protein